MTTCELIEGPRGDGKTHKAFKKLVDTALAKPDGRYLFVGPNPRAELMMDALLAEHGFSMRRLRSWSKTRARIELYNGSTVSFISEPWVDTLRGLRFDGIVADATEVWTRPEKTLEMLRMLLNPDGFLIETRFEEIAKRMRG